MKNLPTPISEHIHEVVEIITAIINKRQAISRIEFSSDQWHNEFNKLYVLPLNELRTIY